MITQVEDEKSIGDAGGEGRHQMAMYSYRQRGFNGYNGTNVGRGVPERRVWNDKRISKEVKRRLKCTNCKEPGHEVHECFKLHGYPEWYRKYKEEGGRARINYMGEGMEETDSTRTGDRYDAKGGESPAGQLDISSLVQAEIAKCMGNLSNHGGNAGGQRTYINMVENKQSSNEFFDGHYAFSIVPSMDKVVWIIDLGASAHVCCDRELMQMIYKLDKPVSIHLPDGSSKLVTTAGRVQLNEHIALQNVLFVQGFTHNLLSVAQLIADSEVKCIFYRSHCAFHKGRGDQVVGIGKVERNLYILETVAENHFTHYFKAEEDGRGRRWWSRGLGGAA